MHGDELKEVIIAGLILHAVVSSCFCMFVASEKNRNPLLWGLWGALFGLYALVAVGLAPAKE